MKPLLTLKFGLLYTLWILCHSSSCGSPQDVTPGPSVESMSLMQTHQAWSTAVHEADVTKIFSYWDENAVEYYPGKPAAYGKKAIKQLVKQNRTTSGFALSSDVEGAYVSESGEMGYTVGAFAVTASDKLGNPVKESGHFLCVWQKTSGVWKCVRSMSTLEE